MPAGTGRRGLTSWGFSGSRPLHGMVAQAALATFDLYSPDMHGVAAANMGHAYAPQSPCGWNACAFMQCVPSHNHVHSHKAKCLFHFKHPSGGFIFYLYSIT